VCLCLCVYIHIYLYIILPRVPRLFRSSTRTVANREREMTVLVSQQLTRCLLVDYLLRCIQTHAVINEVDFRVGNVIDKPNEVGICIYSSSMNGINLLSLTPAQNMHSNTRRLRSNAFICAIKC
jgi:hypothetical protein